MCCAIVPMVTRGNEKENYPTNTQVNAVHRKETKYEQYSTVLCSTYCNKYHCIEVSTVTCISLLSEGRRALLWWVLRAFPTLTVAETRPLSRVFAFVFFCICICTSSTRFSHIWLLPKRVLCTTGTLSPPSEAKTPCLHIEDWDTNSVFSLKIKNLARRRFNNNQCASVKKWLDCPYIPRLEYISFSWF